LKHKLENKHYILFALALIIILRFSRLTDITVSFYYFVKSLLLNFSGTLASIDFNLTDYFISLILLIVFLLHLLMKRKKSKFINKQLNFTSFIIITLLLFFVFAPVISTTEPGFQNNIGISRLLPPFSSLKMIYPVNDLGNDELSKIKNQLLNEMPVYFDSIRIIDGNYYYSQGENLTLLNKQNILFDDGVPVIKSRFFVFGTDEFGRDIFSRLVYGTRISLLIGLGAVIVAFILGTGLGFFSGYSGRLSDTILNRFTDMFLSFPVIFLIILILAFFGNSIFTIILILGFSGWMSLFKIVRSEVIAIKHRDYFITASMIGLSRWKLLTREALPVIAVPVIVNLVFLYGNVILAEAALSYLGLGAGLNYPSWGAMIEEGQEYLSQSWWLILFPGLALVLTLFAANNLGRILNQYFNPRISR
jgi:peptide/nickel transport system permease protein